MDQPHPELGTILSVWAHPDDEAFLAGGIMAMATDAGSRVVCVTATRGEAGSSDPERFPPHVMAKIREQELDECLAILGVRNISGSTIATASAPRRHRRSRDQARGIIGEVRPDTILTFGPEGFTDHPDHKAVSRWLTEAHHRIGGDVETTSCISRPRPGMDRSVRHVMAEVSVFPPGFPPRSCPTR